MTDPDEPAHVALPLPARILAGRCSIPTPSAPLGVAAATRSTAAAVALLALLGVLLALFIARTARSAAMVPEGDTVPPNVPASH